MNLTTLFRLRKPEGTDPVNIEDFNDNFDVIDTELGKRPLKTDPASDMTVAFTQASSRANLTTGEKLSVSLGKIMKFFADLKTVAFSGSYADLSNKPAIPSGAAASYAVANNDTTTASGYVADARIVRTHGLEIDQLSSDLTASNGESFRYGVTEDGQRGYIITGEDGADTVIPFKRGISLIPKKGTQTVTFDRDISNVYVFSGANNVSITLNGTVTSKNVYIGDSYSGLGTQLYTIGAVKKGDTLKVTQSNYGFIIVY